MELPEIAIQVTKYLGKSDLYAASSVCKSWRLSLAPILFYRLAWIDFAWANPTDDKEELLQSIMHHVRDLNLTVEPLTESDCPLKKFANLKVLHLSFDIGINDNDFRQIGSLVNQDQDISSVESFLKTSADLYYSSKFPDVLSRSPDLMRFKLDTGAYAPEIIERFLRAICQSQLGKILQLCNRIDEGNRLNPGDSIMRSNSQEDEFSFSVASGDNEDEYNPGDVSHGNSEHIADGSVDNFDDPESNSDGDEYDFDDGSYEYDEHRIVWSDLGSMDLQQQKFFVRTFPLPKYLSQSLSRAYQAYITAELCDIVSTKCPHIKELDLSYHPLSDENLARILNSCSSSLERLFLNKTYFGALSLEPLLRRHSATLTHLNLLSCDVASSPMVQRILMSCPQLVSFDAKMLHAKDILESKISRLGTTWSKCHS
ncbi:hypothetical protein BGX26_004019 [Mortierella sp. AD094]|nr:hypothetical protein BGX26_004019 [Mortierella sp. AD094]